MPSREHVASFLHEVFGQAVGEYKGYISIWWPRSTGHLFDSVEGATDCAMKWTVAGKDVYVGMGLRRTDRPIKGRGKADDVVWLPGFWVDLDCDMPYRKSKKSGGSSKVYAPDKEALTGALLGTCINPSVLWDSGGGIQALWLVKDMPVDGQLIRSFQDQLREKLAPWDIDATHDVTRVLRIPGTRNTKADADVLPIASLGCVYPVQAIVYRDDAPSRDEKRDKSTQGDEDASSRDTRDDTTHDTSNDATRENRSEGVYEDRVDDGDRNRNRGRYVRGDPKRAGLADAIGMLLMVHEPIRHRWEKDPVVEPKDRSQSGWDLAMANQLVKLPISDQQIADILAAYRDKHGCWFNDDKQRHPTYLGDTIARARGGAKQEQQQQQADQDWEAIVSDEPAEQDDPPPAGDEKKGDEPKSDDSRDRIIRAIQSKMTLFAGIRAHGHVSRVGKYEYVILNTENEDGQSIGHDLTQWPAFKQGMIAIHHAVGNSDVPSILLAKRAPNWWPSLVRQMFRIVEVVKETYDKPGEVVCEWVDQYLSENYPHGIESRGFDVVRRRAAHLHDDRLWISVASLCEFLNGQRVDSTNVMQLGRQMTLAGWYDNREVRAENSETNKAARCRYRSMELTKLDGRVEIITASEPP